MKRAWILVVVLGMALASAGLLPAQKARKQAPAIIAQAQYEAPTPLQVVVQFLQLRPDQIEALGQLLQGRQEAVAPLLQAIAERERLLQALLQSGAAPPEVGQVVIEIHALQAQVAEIQQGFLAQWESLLDPDQGQRLEAVRSAAQLQPVVPAFQGLHLL